MFFSYKRLHDKYKEEKEISKCKKNCNKIYN